MKIFSRLEYLLVRRLLQLWFNLGRKFRGCFSLGGARGVPIGLCDTTQVWLYYCRGMNMLGSVCGVEKARARYRSLSIICWQAAEQGGVVW